MRGVRTFAAVALLAVAGLFASASTAKADWYRGYRGSYYYSPSYYGGYYRPFYGSYYSPWVGSSFGYYPYRSYYYSPSFYGYGYRPWGWGGYGGYYGGYRPWVGYGYGYRSFYRPGFSFGW
jgi:hypothetical protein